MFCALTDPIRQNALLNSSTLIQLAFASFGGCFDSSVPPPDDDPCETSLLQKHAHLQTAGEKSFMKTSFNVSSTLTEDNILVFQVDSDVLTMDELRNVCIPFDCADVEAKLSQLDDLLLALSASSSCPLPTKKTSQEMELLDDQCAVSDPLASFFERGSALNSLLGLTSWWTSAHDAALLRGVVLHGYPDTKRRLLALQLSLPTLSFSITPPCSLPLDSKVVVSRFKMLACLLRGEPIKSSGKPLPYAAAILRTMAKIGYPHKLYSSLLSNDALKRAEYLLTWEQFSQEVGSFPALDTPRLQSFVVEMKEMSEMGSQDNKDMIEKGLLVGLSPKVLREVVEKADSMYRVRVLLSTRTDEVLLAEIEQKAMGTGPNVPPYARDKSMPVWWTPAHDLKLLKMVALFGCNQWKKIVSPDAPTIGNENGETECLSLAEVPKNFTFPPKEFGQQDAWLLTVTAKSAERRLVHILKMINALSLVSDLPQSPVRATATAKKAEQLSNNRTKSSIPRPASYISAAPFVWNRKPVECTPVQPDRTVIDLTPHDLDVKKRETGCLAIESHTPILEAGYMLPLERTVYPAFTPLDKTSSSPIVASIDLRELSADCRIQPASGTHHASPEPGLAIPPPILTHQAPVSLPGPKVKLPETGKRKRDDPKVSAKKQAATPASNILSFFTKKSATDGPLDAIPVPADTAFGPKKL